MRLHLASLNLPLALIIGASSPIYKPMSSLKLKLMNMRTSGLVIDSKSDVKGPIILMVILKSCFQDKFRALVMIRVQNFRWKLGESTALTWYSYTIKALNFTCPFVASSFFHNRCYWSRQLEIARTFETENQPDRSLRASARAKRGHIIPGGQTGPPARAPLYININSALILM